MIFSVIMDNSAMNTKPTVNGVLSIISAIDILSLISIDIEY